MDRRELREGTQRFRFMESSQRLYMDTLEFKFVSLFSSFRSGRLGFRSSNLRLKLGLSLAHHVYGLVLAT